MLQNKSHSVCVVSISLESRSETFPINYFLIKIWPVRSCGIRLTTSSRRAWFVSEWTLRLIFWWKVVVSIWSFANLMLLGFWGLSTRRTFCSLIIDDKQYCFSAPSTFVPLILPLGRVNAGSLFEPIYIGTPTADTVPSFLLLFKRSL